MLSEERQSLILERLRTKRAVTVQELVQDLDSSAATIRRDLTELHQKGLLQKVHGGAVSCDVDYFTTEPDMSTKANLFTDEKTAIAQAAATLIEEHDFVFIDAGTTTEMMLPFVNAKNVTFVTNGTSHAAALAARYRRVILLGGQVKAVTGAIIGDTALQQLDVFNFTKGFFGTNGVSIKAVSVHRIRPKQLSKPKRFINVIVLTYFVIRQNLTKYRLLRLPHWKVQRLLQLK